MSDSSAADRDPVIPAVLVPDRVLVGDGGRPLLYVTPAPSGRRLLVLRLAAIAGGAWSYVVPTSDSQVEALESGRRPLRELLDQPWGWRVQTDAEGRVQAVAASDYAVLAPELRALTWAALTGAPLRDAGDSPALLFHSFAEAFLGLGTQFNTELAVYDFERCVQVLLDQGLTEEDAREYLEFNTAGAWLGPHTPVLLRHRPDELDLEHP